MCLVTKQIKYKSYSVSKSFTCNISIAVLKDVTDNKHLTIVT